MTYDAAVAALSPWGYWKLDDASGTTAADSSGNSRPMSYVNSPTLGQPAIAAGLGASVKLASASSQSVLDGTAFPQTGSMTACIWTKPTSVINSAVLFNGIYDAGAKLTPFALMTEATGKWQAWLYNNGYFLATASSGPSAGAAYFAAVTIGGGTLTFYINAVSVATVAATLPSDTNGYSVGKTADGTYWDGYVSNAALFTTALSASDISNLYTAGTASAPAAAPPFHLPSALRRTAVARSATY